MESVRPPRWYLHVLTYLVVLIECWAFLECNREAMRQIVPAPARHYITESQYGWPSVYLTVMESGQTAVQNESFKSISNEPYLFPELDWHWNVPRLLFNLAVNGFVIGLSALMIEISFRTVTWRQFTIQHILSATTLFSITLALVLNPGMIDFAVNQYGLKPAILFSRPFISRTIQLPMFFGLACTIYTLGWLVFRLTARIYAILFRYPISTS